ncbi:MAG TPA: hypothetical protein VG710_03990 [Opitutus sp.]|nr:hypothetical protein [Opitutus sp.]
MPDQSPSNAEPTVPAAPPAPNPVPPPAAKKPDAPAPPALTPEEQMEAFARELKENDWGHQPC